MPRARTLVVQIYFEVQEVVTRLLRRHAERGGWFPSLHAAARSARPKEKAARAPPVSTFSSAEAPERPRAVPLLPET